MKNHVYTTIVLMPFFLLSYVPFATDHWLPKLFTTVYAIYWLWDLTASRRGRDKVLEIGVELGIKNNFSDGRIKNFGQLFCLMYVFIKRGKFLLAVLKFESFIIKILIVNMKLLGTKT